MQPGKPAVAIIANSQTPYRLHLHRRIARELPEIELWSVFTHEVSNAPWKLESPAEIRPVCFGAGQRSDRQSAPGSQCSEWSKGGEILRWMEERRIRFTVLFGYNDLGRVRILKGCRKEGIPCYLFGDSNILGDRAGPVKAALKKALVGNLVASASGVFYCGRLGRAYFAKYGASQERMFPFPYEPDYSLFEAPDRTSVDEIRSRFRLSPDRHRILYSGRLVNVKRVDLLATAFAATAETRPDWDLVIAGAGPLLESLKSSLAKLPSERISWTGFIDSQKTMAALYSCCDVLALPSDYEPWGVVVTEAAASGMALLCSENVGAAADLVRDGVNGRAFCAGDAAAIEKALMEVTDPANLGRMKAASRNVLADWRREADPIQGLRRALEAHRLIGLEGRR